MHKIMEVFDPPMCCSSGVCGTSVDPKLVQFSGDLQHLKENGVEVKRYNLSTEPAAFVQNTIVKQALDEDGNTCLPLIVCDGALVSKGCYPTRNELCEVAGLPATAEGINNEQPTTKCGPDCCCG